MKQGKLVKEFTAGIKHFYDCIDFGKSHLDAKAVQFMNEMPGRLCNSHDKLLEACKSARAVFEDIHGRHLASSFHNNRISSDCEEAIKFLTIEIAKAEK